MYEVLVAADARVMRFATLRILKRLGLEAGGGDDLLTKPVSPVVLESRIRAMRRPDDMRRELTAVTLELREANERLSRLSQRDGLAGLANRRRFDLDLARELARARREGLPLSLLIADIDHFKRFSDAYGHPAGDECLRPGPRPALRPPRR